MQADDVERCIERFGRDVYRFCIKLTGIKLEADDLYQQTFLRLLEMKVQLDWEDNPKSFLFSVTNGIWKNERRKKARRDFIAPCSSISEMEENLPGQDASTENQVFTRLELEDMRKEIGRLNQKLYIPVILYYAFDLSIEEIAVIEKIPEGTVKSRLHKARKILRKGLEEKGYEK